MEEIALPDGRRAQLWTGGAASAPAVLVCHGTPDTRWIARTGASAAASAGVRLVCVNRPGYGTSTPTDSTMSSVADDAVACSTARRRPGRRPRDVRRRAYAAALPPATPTGSRAGPRRRAPEAARYGPAGRGGRAGPPEFAQWAAGVNVADPDDAALAARWLGSQPPDDAALLAAALSTTDVAASVREALACHDGYLRDAALLVSDWGFDLSDVRCPTHLWYGAADDRNPPATGRWWAERVTGAELTLTPHHPPRNAARQLARDPARPRWLRAPSSTGGGS